MRSACLRLSSLLLLATAASAAAPPSISGASVMAALQEAWSAAGAATAAAPAGGARGLRPFLGRLLAQLETPLRAVWDAATPAEQAAARARAVSPLAAAPPHSPLPGPYYRWIPELLGSALPSGAPASWAGGSCFASGSATGGFAADGASYTVNLTVAAPANASCSDIFWVATPEWFDFVLINGSQAAAAPFTASLSLPVTARPFARQWVQRKGALVMRFLDGDILTVVWEVLATISLFIPAEITSPIAPADAQRVYDFLAAYANITMKPRGAVQNVTLDPALFHSGDLLLVHRPDGLGSVEQWGTGAHTTHVVQFMRDAARELWVVESQSAGADWPIDRIQKNRWADWQAMAYTASYSWIWLPTTAANRAVFDEAKAWAYINATLGVNYGYQDFAVTFYDTEFQNLPWPAVPQELEVLLGVLDGLLGGVQVEGVPIVNILFTQTMVQHLGLSSFNMSYLEACEHAAAAGLTFGALLAQPEQDSYRYPMATGVGPTAPSLVCDAYACAVHKAAGSFGDLPINCADQHNTDVYSMNIFEAAPVRPQQCVDADPDNLHCQLAGTHSFTLAGAGTVAPYAHMDETCPSLPTAYARPAGC